MFQNLRTNSQVFILHKESTPYIEYGSVVSVSGSRATCKGFRQGLTLPTSGRTGTSWCLAAATR